MKKVTGNTLLGDLKHVSAMLREEHAAMDAENPEAMRANALAARVLNRLDPDAVAPLDVRLLAHATLAHMAASLCANVHRAEEATHEQMTMTLFDAGLQPRYPVERNDETQYVLRALMTLPELRANAERLRREGEAKIAHANALDAETDEKISRGYFNEHGEPLAEMSR
jgi:hypothetical protein